MNSHNHNAKADEGKWEQTADKWAELFRNFGAGIEELKDSDAGEEMREAIFGLGKGISALFSQIGNQLRDERLQSGLEEAMDSLKEAIVASAQRFRSDDTDDQQPEDVVSGL